MRSPKPDSLGASAPGQPDWRNELGELVRRAESDDRHAQGELVQRYTRRLAGFLRPLLRDPDTIEDVTQVVFIKMFRQLPRLRDPRHFEAWLFTLARNAALDCLRRQRCRPATVAWDDGAHEIPDPGSDQASAEIMSALERALVRLSPLDRSLVSAVVAGERYRTIAVRTGLSVTAIKVRLHRVRPFLRAWVGEMTGTRQTRRHRIAVAS